MTTRPFAFEPADLGRCVAAVVREASCGRDVPRVTGGDGGCRGPFGGRAEPGKFIE